MDFRFSSKADVLEWLRPRVKHSCVEKLYVCTVDRWMKDADTVFREIQKEFPEGRIVMRSSSLQEDGLTGSRAGYFKSVLDLPVLFSRTEAAAAAIIDSYKRAERDGTGGGPGTDREQILVQSQTGNIRVSGVVFTRQIETNAPYYVINYDDRSGRTDTVTGGMEGKVIYISHFADASSDARWRGLIRAVKELEFLFKGAVLDIEFAITGEGKVVIFQVRPLAANRDIAMPEDGFTRHLIEDMVKKFSRFSQRVPHLAGETTVLGDMPDWNPSEIIGSRPNTLDYTMYSFIVTDEVWHEARSSLGYYDVYPAELMLSFGKKPYIDARASFNSFTPADMPHELREKLVNYYLDKLRKNPAYQDKVEFEILWTCYDFLTAKKLNILSKHGFSSADIDTFSKALKGLTNSILKDSRGITEHDLKQVKLLTERRDRIMRFYGKSDKTPWNSLHTAYGILQNCKRFGTFPFSRQARLAFIAKSFLISLRKEEVVSEEFYHDFLNSIRTVASEFNDDFYRLQNGELDKDSFIGQYGHLRAGTYDITTPRYDSSSNLFDGQADAKAVRRPMYGFNAPKKVLKNIDKLMELHGIHGNGAYLMDFMRSAVRNRECAKFEFTRSLSDALELIAEAGKMLGFDREQLCHADLPTIMKFRNPEHGDSDYARKIIKQSIDRHKKEREWYDAVILPPVIISERDFYYVEPYEAIPNFITRKSVKGRIITFDEIKHMKEHVLEGRIVLLENADPGFDWIFTKRPLGIVTKYGGVASHMSIRCAEFGIPAAIGCGDVIYDGLKKAKLVELDCMRKTVRPLNSHG